MHEIRVSLRSKSAKALPNIAVVTTNPMRIGIKGVQINLEAYGLLNVEEESSGAKRYSRARITEEPMHKDRIGFICFSEFMIPLTLVDNCLTAVMINPEDSGIISFSNLFAIVKLSTVVS